MKKTFQRWLAMLLAVLMVMGTLPTSAWAARREEEFAEQPVIGEGDGVTDTLGKHDDGGEYPVDPVDPSDPPADLNDVNITAVTPSGGSMVDGRYEISGLSSASFSGTVTVGTGDPNDQIAVLIFPNYATRAGVDTPASTWKGLDFVGTFVNDGNQTNVKNALSTYANGEPYYFLRTNSVAAPSVVFHGSQDELKDTAGNSLSPINKPTQVEFTDGDKSWFEPDYLNGKTNIYLANSTTPINVSETGVPFTVFIGGSSGFHYADVWIKGSNQPLKVEITPKEKLQDGTNLDYSAAPTTYAVATIYNNTDDDMTGVEVTIYRKGFVNSKPSPFAKEEVKKDDGNQDIHANCDANFDNTVNDIYTLAEAEDSTTGRQTLTIDILARDSVDVYIAGVDGDAIFGFDIVTDVGGDLWSNYTVKAVYGSANAHDNAGIHWTGTAEFKPLIQLVDTAGAAIGVAGTAVRGNDTTDDIKHTVVVGGKVGGGIVTMVYNETTGYYEPQNPDDRVGLVNVIQVDGTTLTGVQVQSNDVTPVTMYKVGITDSPVGKAEDNLGTFIGANNFTAIQYDYYAPGATVRTWANANGFDGWTNASEDTSYGGAGGDKIGRISSLNGNTNVIANYALYDLTVVTTLGGDNADYLASPNDRSIAHVHSIQVKQGNTVVASAIQKTDGSYILTDMTVQTATQPWKVTVGKGTYTLEINGFEVETIDTNNLPATTPMYIEELAGVKPVVTGATEAEVGFGMLPDDQNPNRSRGTLDIDKDGDATLPLYYPVGATIKPYVYDGMYDRLETLTYPAGTDIKPADYSGDGTDQLSIVVVRGAEQILEAVYGQSLELWMYLDGTQYTTDMAANIVLKPVGAADDSGNIAVTQSEDYGYIYTSNTALAAGTTYEIWVNGFNTGLKSTSDKSNATLGEGDAATAHTYIPVPMQSVTVADQSGITTTTASSFTGGRYTGATSGHIPNGCKITVAHGAANNYAANGWTFAKGTATTETGNFTYTASATTGNDSQGAQTLTAQYVASTGKATVNIYLDGDLSDDPVTTDAGVDLYKGTSKVADLSKDDTGVYSASVAPDTYNVYIDGNDTEVTIDVTTDGESADVKYWTVSVSTDGNGKATVTANDKKDLVIGGADAASAEATGTTPATVVVIEGTSVTWAFGDPNTYYEKDTWNGKTNDYADITTATGGVVAATEKSQKALFKQKMANVTVTVKLNGTAGGVGKAVKVTVNGVEKTVAADANAAAAVLTFSVPERAAGYTVTVDGAPEDWSTGPVYAPTGEDRPSNADVNFYALTLASGGNGFVDFATTAPTANGATLTQVGLSGTVVDIAAGPATNYKFVNWTDGTADNFGTGATTAVQKYTITKQETLTANFSHEKFDTYLTVTVNGDPVTNTNRYGDGKDVTSIKLVGASATTDLKKTIAYENDHWVVKGLLFDTESDLRWEVTTVDGGKYYTTVAGDDKTATETLFGITIEGGVGGNDASHSPKLKAQTASNEAARIVTRRSNTNTTVALNKVHTDYSFESYLAGNATNPTTALTAAQGVGTSTTFVLDKDYKAPDDHADLYLKPVYSFKATVKVVYDGKPHTADSIELKTGGGSVTSKSENEFTNLVPGTTYNVWVNGFDTGVDISAPATETITMRKISVAKLPTDATATVQIKLGAGSYVTDGAVYVPNGVTVTTTAPTVSIKATENADYKLDTTAWTVASDGDVAAITTATAAETTVVSATDKKITADVVATAHFTRQYDLTTYVSNGNASITPRSNSKFEGGTGDGTASGSANTKTIAKDTYVKVTFTGGPGETLDSWTLANGGSGSWRTTAPTEADNAWTTWADATKPGKTVTSFYFKPSADSTITAAVGTKPYPIKVRVYLDGTLLTKDSTEISSLKLGTETINKTTDWHAGADGAEGYWEVKLLPNNTTGYTLSTDVTGTLTAATSSTANIKFDVTAGEAGGLEVSVKYWTITVETSGHGNALTKDGERTAATNYTATTPKISDSHIVENGHTISWTTANPETHYEFKSWQTQQTVDGELKWVDIETADAPGTVSAAHHLRARFGRKIATLIVTFRKNGVQDTYTGDNPYTLTVTSADGTVTMTQAGSTSTYTATVDQGVAYTIAASRDDYIGSFTATETLTGNKTVYVDYYEVIANTFVKEGGTAADARGDAKLIIGSGDSKQELTTDYKNVGGEGATTSKTAVVVKNTPVQWEAHRIADNYSFDQWDSTTPKTTANPYPATAAAITAKTEHTAYFTKDKYNTYLYLTVNGDAYGTAAADDDNIKSVKLVKSQTDATEITGVTVEYVEAKTLWAAEGVPEANEPWWRVETVDGGVYYKEASRDDKSSDVSPVVDATGDTTKDKAVVREPLFGVVIERGAGNDTTVTYTPTLQAQVGSDPKTRIVTEAEVAATVDLNKKSGYTWSKWLSKQSGSPADTDDLNTTDHGTSTTTTTADGTFALVKGYTAPATGDDKDLHIKPVYTFTTTIVTKYKTDPTDVTKVEINDSTTTTTVNKETTGTGDHTGRYTASGLDPEKTYTIIVNGFPSTVTFDKDDAGEDVDVTIFKVTVEQEDKKDNTLTPDGKAYVKLGANATGASATSVYLPIGATTTTGETDETKVNLTAAVGDTNPVFRLYNKDNAATDNYDEILWNAAFTAPAGKTMTAAIATNTGTQTPNNLTVGGADGMQADVTITAYFLRQYDLTVSAVKEDKTTPATSKVNVTEKQGLGTSDLPANAAQSVTMSKVDEQTYVKVEFQKAVGETFIGWDFTAADGKLYTGVKDGAVDPDTEVAPAAAATNTATTVYFVPAKDGATLKAVVKAATYNVKVTVKLDNTEYKNENLKVELRGSDGKTIELFDEKDGNQTGVFTIPESVVTKASPEVTYKIYVNGVALGATLVDGDYTEKDIYFTAEQAEGIKADGNPATTDEEKEELQANLEKTINYYTVNLKADPEGTDPTQNKISFAAITGSNTGKTTDSKIFLAKAAGYDIDIYSKVYAGRGTTDTVHYRFVDWTETATTYGFVNKDADNTAYKFPKEETLVADTTNIDGTQDGKQLTLTANFKEQYKVTVKGGYNASSSVSPQVMVTGDTAANPWKTTVYVDEGGTVDLQTSGSIAGLHFQSWTIAKKAAPNETEDDGRGKFQNEDDATKYEAERGTKKANADNTTNPNNLNGFKPEDDTVIDLNLWKEPELLDGLWTYERGVGKENNKDGVKKFTWKEWDAQKITKVTVKGINSTSYAETELTKGTDYDLVDGKIVLLDPYIDDPDLEQGDYTITVTYTLGTTYNEVEGLTKETNFYIKQTPYTLTRVDIGVPTKTAAEDYTRQPDKTLTMNIDATDSKTMQAAYLESDDSHLHKSISKDDLTFTWFWAAKAPTQGVMSGTTLTNYNAGTLPTGWHKITDTDDFTATFTKNAEGNYTAVPTFTSNGTDYTDLKGNYVFAVVTATTTGEGTVITNAISVDYDATISVYEDGTGAAHLIQDAQKDHYTVYLWDANSTENFPANPAADGSKAIPANYSTTDKKYHTEGSKLNATKTYHVYVQEVEGDKTHYLILGGNTPTTITRTANTADVYYYTVTTQAVSKETSAKNNIADATAASGAPGETFDATPTFSAKTGNDTAIPSGNGVLQGSHVKANANKLEGKNVGWEQDYDLTWMNKGATGDYTDVTGTNKVQTSTTAVSVGYEHTQNLTGVLTISGRLTQNTYTIEGDVKDVGGKAINAGGGAIKTATLSSGEGANLVEYTGTLTPATGGHNAKVTFTVPRAAAEAYTLEATPTDGTSSTPKTTMKGYTAPSSTTAPTTVNTSVKLGEVAAGTTGNDLKNRFTIFVAATSLKMKVEDGDNTTGHYNESSNPDAYVFAGHSETWVYANYPAWEKTITVTNTGNTELAVTLVLQKSTDGGTNWTDIYKTGTDLGGDGKDTDTNGVQFIDLEDTFTLGLADGNKSKSFTVKVPDDLQNSDDVKYRFDFVTKDGRGGTNPANGPKMYFNLDLTIEPVTIGRVTTRNDDGTFRVQDHWLKEDAIRNGATEANLNNYYSADTPKNHNWAAETLKADNKKTTMDDLVKQGDALEGGGTADEDPANSDIKYLWYVGDPDAVVTLNKTTGALTCTNGKTLTDVTGSAGDNGTSYKPTTNDHGKMLYLVAVGQRNATNAVMTPDKDTFHEDPVPIPYPATITLYENWVESDGTVKREQVKEADKDNYSVWLWDVTGGKTDELDITDTTGRAIEATPVVADGKCTYKTEVVLYPDHEYQVWTSAAKTADGTAFYLRNTGITIASVDQKAKDVNYYLVDVADTELSQNTYATELADANIVDNSQYFYKTTDLTGDLKKPVAKMPDKGAATATLDVTSNYVLNNTEVTFGFGDRDLDYDLNWGGGMTAVTDKPTDTVSHKLTYKDAAKAAVTTELELRLYDVDAYVVGQGVVSRVTMTMVDGENKYTFVTDTDGYTAGANETVLLGMKGGTAVTSINTGGNATFRLPKYTGGGGYETIASHDAAYTLSGYYAKHGDSSTLHDPVAEPGEGTYVPFHKSITAADAYDIVLQGDSYDMRVTDNVNTGTKKDTSGASAKYGDGLYDQNKTGDGQKNTDGTVNQSITLNYNYGAEQNIKLTVTNETKQPELPNAPLSIYDVTFTQKKAEGGIKVSDTATNDFAGGSVDEMGRKDATDATKGTRELTLTIPDNLAVGRYEYQAEFTYLSEDGVANTGAKVTYNLVVIVEPLTFNSVDVKKNDDGKLTIDPAADKQYTVTRKKTAEDGENPDLIYRDLPNTTTTNPDANSKLVQDTDYGYQWISAPVSATAEQVKAALTWNNGTLTVGNANGVTACTDADATQKVYTPKDDDSGRNLFLVIYGKDNATGTRRNATHFALSPAQTNTYKGMVALKVDDAEKRGKDDADSADTVNKPNDGDGYEVWFISKNDATDKTKATWTKVDDEYAYVADLLPNDNGYSVEISRAKDDSKKVTLTGATIDGTNVKTTIDTTGSNVVEAPFFTVNALAFVNKEYQTGTGEDFTGVSITPTVTIGTDHAELANHTPVLSGQTVAAKAPAMAAPNADKAWTQDYTLTWRQKSDDNTATTVTDTNLTDTTTKGQSATAAIADGAYAFGTVSAKTFIGGRLDQTTYKIVGTIHGPTGNTQQVKNVTLTSDTTPAVIYYSDANTAGAGQTGIQSGVWTKDNNDGKHNDGDQVTFTVVKGTYTVTGYEDTNFTIRKVTVEGTDVDSTPRNEKTFTQSVEKLAEAKRVFDIYLEATGPKLTVNDKVTTTITATSELPDHNHQFADNNSGAHYYYKQLGSDGVFTLELSNPGNVDLKLKAPEVYKVKTGTDYSNSTKLQAALTAGTTSQVTITNGNGTDVVDTNRTILTFANLPAGNDDVLVGKSVSHDGITLANAGTITVSKDVYNKDDAIYVVKFASEYLTTDGAPAVTGPTVYYVLDLQVEPLPIKKVTAETDPTKTDGTLRLKDFVATGDNANDGLNSVLVDHDRDNDPDDLMGAKTAGLVDADISYVWYSAPTDKTVNAADFQFNATSGALELSAAATGKDLKLGLNANTGKTYTPTDAEQGRNFYLVAYRTDADKNASDFAVSDAVYAQVTIAMEAHRTGKVNKSDTEATSLLTEVNISTMVGEDKKTSNADTVTVTGVADNANVLTFNATKTDVTATGAADDPAAAKWYFKSWAVKPLTGDELDATDTSIETPVGGERLTMNYTATGKATVIGYFDKLPELSYKNGALAGGYVIGNDADEVKNDRTLTYTHNDGSGTRKVRVFIAPADDGKSVFGGTWADKTEEELTFGYFDTVAGVATGSSTELGVDGEYVLSREQLIKPYLKSGSTYVITFYDMEKGAKAENGYEGYDRSVTLTITAGNFDVTARAKDANDKINGNQGGVVRLYTTKPTDDTGFVKEDKKTTSGGFIQAEAKAEPGYRFVEWKVLTHDDDDAVGNGGTMTPANGKSLVVSFSPDGEGAILEASFEKAPFTPQADAKTSVYYGDDALQETNDTLVVSVTKDATATQNFSYALATEAELTTYLDGAARPANAYTTDGKPGGDGNPNTNVVPAWLAYAVDATDNTKVNFTVKANTPATGVNVQKTTGEDGKLKDVEDELVVYLKVTETNTTESKIVPVTIDVMTSQLKIRTAGTQADETTLDGKTQAEFDGAKYKDKFIAAYGPTAGANADPTKVDQDQNEILHGSAVEAVMFEFLKIDNEKNANDVFIDEAINPAVNTAEGDTDAKNGTFENKGKWSWNPLNHTGSGNSKPTNSNTYTFTFTYDTGKDEEKWNYEGESIEIKLPVLRPKRSLLIADKVKNYADVKTVLVPGGDDDYSTIKTAGETDAAPVELDYTTDTFRKNESITYLDTEPVYTAIFQRTGVITDIELTIEPEDGKETVGFEVPTQAQLDAIAASLTSTDDVKEATLDLTVTAVHDKVWVGEHYIRFHLTGKDDQGDDVDAYYTLSLTIDPRLITAVDVTTEYNKTEPTDVTPTIEGDPTLNDKGEDTKGNTPIKDATVTWETEDAKNPVPVKETVTVEIDPNYKIVPDDIKPETELNGKNDKDTPEETGKNPDPNTVVTPEEPAEDKTDGGKITITQLHPILMFNDQKEGDDNSKAGPAVNHVRHLTSVKVGSDPTALGKVLIDLGAYSSDVYDVDVEVKVNDFAANGGVLTPELPEGQLLWPQIGMIAKDGKTHYVMDLTGLDTSKAMAYVLRLEAKGTEKDGGAQTILATYELHLRVTPNSPPPSGGGEVCPCKVFYHVGLHGTTTDATVEDVSESNRPSKIPTVTALDGYAFRGWSLTNPATLKQGEKIELVDPKTVTVKGDAMTFYAVIVERPFHEHYVIGYPNGNFGPADNINRASVATIIARAILPDFVEGANYGNPGGYSDVSGHWAESAIAYCSKFDVFKGYTDGTFRPDQPITRQEFATVIARLDGELTAKDIPFDDIDEAGDWAMNGIYTSYEKGWVNGYTDGTFKPLNNIRRDEAVKVFNAYLNRGVDADGLADLHEYVHTGVASNNTENGVDEYMTWPDVPKGHWAYYEIVEAANDHEFTPDFDAELGYTLPEHWEKCWIDERWRYGDGPSGGDSAAMVSAGFQVWLH